MNTGIYPSTRWDIGLTAEFLRNSDVVETILLAKQTGRYGPDWSLKEELLKAFDGDGEFWTMWIEDCIVGIGGLVPTQVQPEAVIWFLGTDLADSQWRTMTRYCRKMKNKWSADGWLLHNVVPLSDRLRISWLRHLGFDIISERANDPFEGFVPFMSLPDKRPLNG